MMANSAVQLSTRTPFITVRNSTLRKGNVFTPVCDSVHGGVSASVHPLGTPAGYPPPTLGRPPPLRQTPLGRPLLLVRPLRPGRPPRRTHPWADTPWADTPQADTPTSLLRRPHPARQTAPLGIPPPLRDNHYCGGRYASYWNAFLLCFFVSRDLTYA